MRLLDESSWPFTTVGLLRPARGMRGPVDVGRGRPDWKLKPPAIGTIGPFLVLLPSAIRVSPPAVHRMVLALAEKGLITRVPGQARSIRIVEPGSGAKTRPPPRKPADFISEPIDPEITPLVMALRADPVVVTKGSCWGHRRKPAYIDLAVEGMAGLRHFVERLNVIDRKVRSEALFVVELNWSEEVVTACAFDIFPNWIMLSWTIEGTGPKRSPSAALLARIAKLYVGR